MSTARETDRARVFFALWPDDAVRAHLALCAREARAQCGGRQITTEKIHLTLFFVGDVERGRIPVLEALASKIRAAPFELEVNTLGYWRHNRLVWAGTTRASDALSELVSRLSQALAGVDIHEEERRYVPHVTLVRNAVRAPQNPVVSGFAWRVREFVLVESMSTADPGRYDIIRRWPLVA